MSLPRELCDVFNTLVRALKYYYSVPPGLSRPMLRSCGCMEEKRPLSLRLCACLPTRPPQMDRASEFVGRSLYVLESAAMEAFRPVDGACRLDATLEVNKTYFAAMFRHMQVRNSSSHGVTHPSKSGVSQHAGIRANVVPLPLPLAATVRRVSVVLRWSFGTTAATNVRPYYRTGTFSWLSHPC